MLTADLSGLDQAGILDAVATFVRALRQDDPEATFRVDGPDEGTRNALRDFGVLGIDGVESLGVNEALAAITGTSAQPIAFEKIEDDETSPPVETEPSDEKPDDDEVTLLGDLSPPNLDAAGIDPETKKPFSAEEAARRENDRIEAAAVAREEEAQRIALAKAAAEAEEHARKVAAICDRARNNVNEVGAIPRNRRSHEQRETLIYIARGLTRLDNGDTGKALADFAESEALLAEHAKKIAAKEAREAAVAAGLNADKRAAAGRREVEAAKKAE